MNRLDPQNVSVQSKIKIKIKVLVPIYVGFILSLSANVCTL